MSHPNYQLAARRAAKKFGIDPAIFLRQINAESGFNPNSTSPAGARGIAQFIPSTAKAYGVNLNDGRVTDDLEGAARYMAANLKRAGGDYRRALSIYNSGRPDGYKSIPETRAYVDKILNGQTPKVSDLGGLASVRTTSSSNAAEVAADTERNRKRAIVESLIAKHNPNSELIKSGVLAPIAVPALKVTTSTAPASGTTSSSGTAPTGGGNYKVASFDGHEVRADWIPALKYARAHGWQGDITSGVRTYAEQKKLYARYLAGGNIAAKPGQSNHEIENGGAIDVSDPSGLHHALAGFNGAKPIWALTVGLNDSVHFSANGH